MLNLILGVVILLISSSSAALVPYDKPELFKRQNTYTSTYINGTVTLTTTWCPSTDDASSATPISTSNSEDATFQTTYLTPTANPSTATEPPLSTSSASISIFSAATLPSPKTTITVSGTPHSTISSDVISYSSQPSSTLSSRSSKDYWLTSAVKEFPSTITASPQSYHYYSTYWSTSTTYYYEYTTTTITLYLGPTSSPKLPAGSINTNLGTTKSNPVTCGTKVSSSFTPTIDTQTLTQGNTVTSTSSSASGCSTVDLFEAISTDAPSSSLFNYEPLDFDIIEGIDNGDTPYETNKFYANLFLGSQASPVFTYPYSFWWSYNVTSFNGLGISHTTEDQLVFGEDESESQGGAASYYINPVKIMSLLFTAEGFENDNVQLGVMNMTATSALAKLSASSKTDFISFPLVQSMGFVTSVYHGNLVAQIKSEVGIKSLFLVSSQDTVSNVQKYHVQLYNGVTWLLYATVPDGNSDFSLNFEDNYIASSAALDGLVLQVAVSPSSDQEYYYDVAAGLYVTSYGISGYTDDCGVTANYFFDYETEGENENGSPFVFLLPHHESIITSETSDSATGIYLFSTTKGYIQGYLTNNVAFEHQLESRDVGFLPYSTLTNNTDLEYTQEQIQLLASTANHEFSVDIINTLKGLTTYYAGKYIDKFSYITLVANDIIQDSNFSSSCLSAVKKAFETFFSGELTYQLIYDTKLKGITSNAANSGDINNDFGAGYYSDHHFHYGYFIHAAAIVGYIDSQNGGSWIDDNRDYINGLIRDVNNPSTDDVYFPVSRMFDWFHGHSWAAGLFEASDGKNQESSSEDFNFAYGMKMWGSVIGDKSMEYRGDLMLSIMKKSMNMYYYYLDSNSVEPSKFIANKVGGILFDNKIDHTTYFGTNPEYIHGIHMIPTTPVSSIIRGPEFTAQEWNESISSFVDSVKSGWTGLLRLNEALFDPESSYEFFSDENFNYAYLDDGQSRTWSLAYSGGISNLLKN